MEPLAIYRAHRYAKPVRIRVFQFRDVIRICAPVRRPLDEVIQRSEALREGGPVGHGELILKRLRQEGIAARWSVSEAQGAPSRSRSRLQRC